MRSFRLSRRAMLRGAGGIAIGLPLLEIMRPLRQATGATGAAPKRFVVFFTPDGTIRNNWLPTVSGSSFAPSRILQPLTANQSHIVVIDGVDNKAAQNGPGDDHMKGMGTMLTGIELLPGTTQGGCCEPAGLAGGISVDQAIANKIGTTTQFKSLEVGVQSTGSGTVWNYTSYSDANMPLPPDINPSSVFTRVFGGLGADATATARLQAERKSVLDAVMASYQKLGPKLGKDDKAKLDAHLANVRDLETRLTATGSLGASCMKPAMPTVTSYKSNDSFPQVGQVQMDLVVMAMACDLTRVATIQWEKSVGDVQFDWVDSTIARGHHDMSHDPDDNADTQEKLTKINIWFAQQLNYLIEAMKKVPEGSGTMLDNTLILWCNELSKGNAHSHDHMPFLLAGHAGGALRGNQFLQLSKIPHNNLLVSCMNLMGLPDTTFGNPAYCTGPLSGLA
jgi:hypothetical protein